MRTDSDNAAAREKWLTPEEVANEMDVSVRTAQRMCRRGDLPARKMGKAWRIQPDYKQHLPTAETAS